MDEATAEQPIAVQPVGPSDLELICQHREEMFRDAGSDERSLAAMTANFRSWLEPRLTDGTYFGYVLTSDGEPAGGVGLMLIDWPPHSPASVRRSARLRAQPVVEPAHRRQGLARRLMQLAEAELSRRGVTLLVLHATEKGRPLYAELGWVPGTAEMVKSI